MLASSRSATMLASDNPPPADAICPVSLLAIELESVPLMLDIEVSDAPAAVSEFLDLQPAISMRTIAAAAAGVRRHECPLTDTSSVQGVPSSVLGWCRSHVLTASQ